MSPTFELQRARLKRSLDLNEIEEIKRKPIQTQKFTLITVQSSHLHHVTLSLSQRSKSQARENTAGLFMGRRQPRLENSLG